MVFSGFKEVFSLGFTTEKVGLPRKKGLEKLGTLHLECAPPYPERASTVKRFFQRGPLLTLLVSD